MSRIFLLSPAQSAGSRAKLLCREGATFELARQIQIHDATLGSVFSFCSGLYFRGKLAYARKFARDMSDVAVITPSRGLLPPDTLIGVADLLDFSKIRVEADEPAFTKPLEKSATSLASTTTSDVVLLGSIATGKYVETLLPIFGSRLLFPKEFVGRGDMSRGGLLLRCAASGKELEYVTVAGAVRRGRKAANIATMHIR